MAKNDSSRRIYCQRCYEINSNNGCNERVIGSLLGSLLGGFKLGRNVNSGIASHR